MSPFQWCVDLLEKLGGLWDWLSTPLFEDVPGLAWTTPLSLIGFGFLGIILIAKVVKAFLP